MPHIEWDPALETGYADIDLQHRGFFRLFNDLLGAEGSGDDSAVLSALERLTEYVIVHFSAEEMLMEERRYPSEAAEAHRTEHRELTARTREIVIDYRTGAVTTVLPLVRFLNDWLVDHIEESDRALVSFLVDEG